MIQTAKMLSTVIVLLYIDYMMFLATKKKKNEHNLKIMTFGKMPSNHTHTNGNDNSIVNSQEIYFGDIQ